MVELIELNEINMVVCPVGILKTNCYIIYKKESKEAIVIDPGDMSDYIIDNVKKIGVDVVAVFLTHGHFDHITAINDLKKVYPVKVYVGEDDEELIKDPLLNCSEKFRRGILVEADEILKDNQVVEIAGLKFVVLKTPGHTKGSVCFYFEDEKLLISGDTLFRESIGRTDFPTGSARDITNSIKNKLFVLEDDVMVYTGHGVSTTIGYERVNNIYVDENFY